MNVQRVVQRTGMSENEVRTILRAHMTLKHPGIYKHGGYQINEQAFTEIFGGVEESYLAEQRAEAEAQVVRSRAIAERRAMEALARRDRVRRQTAAELDAYRTRWRRRLAHKRRPSGWWSGARYSLSVVSGER